MFMTSVRNAVGKVMSIFNSKPKLSSKILEVLDGLLYNGDRLTEEEISNFRKKGRTNLEDIIIFEARKNYYDGYKSGLLHAKEFVKSVIEEHKGNKGVK
jgi:hypothetical protein